MRVWIPHTPPNLHAVVVATVREQGGAVELHENPSDDPYAWGRFWRERWRDDADLIVVEGDKVPPPAALVRFESCRHLWCLHAHRTGPTVQRAAIGCVRFRRRLLREQPRLADLALGPTPRRPRGVSWESVDMALVRELHIRGVTAHVHAGVADHLSHVGAQGALSH